MPTDIAAAITRKRKALKLAQDNQAILLGCCIVCLVVLVLLFASPTFARAVELLTLG